MTGLNAVEPLRDGRDHLSQAPDQPRLTVEQALHLPALLSVRELAPLWGVGVSHMHKLEKRCALDIFKVHPPIGPRCFSGVLIGRYLSGEPLVIPTFGRKRAGR